MSRTPALFYKYRGIEPWEFLLDIFINRRLFAASYQSLNDPMEGVFTYSQDNASPSFIEQMMRRKANLGICSLSKSFNSTVMWSYYAAAHKGVVIGVEVSRRVRDVIDISEVTYAPDNVFRGFLGSDAETEARKILSKKLTAWEHEKEVRVFARSKFVPVRIRTVYLGCQMAEPTRKLITHLLKKLDTKIQIKAIQRDQLDSRLPNNAI